MSNKTDIYAVNKPVSVFDYLTVKPEQRETVVELFNTEYQPLAAERGLHFVSSLWMPPVDSASTDTQLVFEWQYNNVAELWLARGAEETDQRLKDFWLKLASLVISRRRYLARSEKAAGLSPKGAKPAVKQPNVKHSLKRALVFVKPEPMKGDKTKAANVRQQSYLNELAMLSQHNHVLHSSAGINAGSYTGREGEITWDLLLNTTSLDGQVVSELSPSDVLVDELVVLGEPIAWGFADADLSAGVKRSILFDVRGNASEQAIKKMEQVLIEWAQQLSEIGSWSLSKVASSSGSVAWTHCYEQEFVSQAAITGAYLNHPFHWSVADRYFHPEAHQQVADKFFHSIRPITESILRPMQKAMTQR